MSDTSGQDSGGSNNGIFSNPTFQKLLQKTIGLVAQLHGGQDPNAQGQQGAPQGGQPLGAPQAPQQSNIQPGTFQSPQGAVGGAMLSGNQGATNPSNITPPQGGGSGGGQGSAPPSGATGQTLGAPQLPQQGPQQGPTSHNGMTLDQAPWSQRNQLPPQGGGSGGGQGSAPPSGATGQRVFPQAQMGQPLGAPQLPQQGYGGQGQQQQNFAQAPWQAAPIQDWGAFNKANPMPKPPSYEDAAGVAEQMMNQKGFAPVGSNTNSLDYTPMIPGILDKMNEQYKEQMAAHTNAFTGQIAGAHAHNQAMAEAERARHDKAQEKNTADSITGKGTAAANSTAQKASAADQKHSDFQAHLNVLQQKADTALEAVRNAEKGKSRDQAIKVWQEAQKNARSFEADYVNEINGNNADTPEGKAELDRLRKGGDAAGSKPPPGGTGDKQYPTPDASHIKMLKDGAGTPEQFDEAFGPGSAAKYK